MVLKSSSDAELGDVWLIEEAGLKQAIRVRPHEPIDDPIGLLKGHVPAQRLAFKRHSGKQVTDLLATTYAVLFLVSERFRRLLRDSSVTGWATLPVMVEGLAATAPPHHELFLVTGRCGPLDNSRSPRVWRDSPVPGGKPYQTWVGLYFDPGTWDGSEIFCPDGSGHVFVVGRVRDVLADNVSNVRFRPILSVERTML
jgi:hypothetical protein